MPFDEHDFRMQFMLLAHGLADDRRGVEENPLVVDWDVRSWRVDTKPYTTKLTSFARPAAGGVRRRRLASRQEHSEHRATTHSGFDLDAAARLLGDRAHDRQTEAVAAGSRRERFLE